MATQTFDSTSLNDWKPEAWAGSGFTSGSSFLLNPSNFSQSDANPVSNDGGGLSLSSFNAPSDVDHSKINGNPNIGAQLTTQGNFSQTYGYFEMNAKLSDVGGTTAGFWMMPADGSWPPELDVAEVVGNAPNTLVNTVHSNTDGTTPRWTDVANTADGYHTYGVDWEADKITWYFDGKQVQQQDTPGDMHGPMTLVLSESAGNDGSWSGAPSDSFHSTMNVAWVHAYSSKPGGSGATAQSDSEGATAQTDDTVTPATVGANAITASAQGGMQFMFNGSDPAGSIADFNPLKDAVVFDDTKDSFGSLNISADPTDGHAVIQSDNNVVSVMGVTPDQMTAQNVLFNIST